MKNWKILKLDEILLLKFAVRSELILSKMPPIFINLQAICQFYRSCQLEPIGALWCIWLFFEMILGPSNLHPILTFR